MMLKELLPILLIITIFPVFLIYRKISQRMPDWIAYGISLTAMALTILLFILYGSTKYLFFIITYFVLSFVFMIHIRKQRRKSMR